MAPKCRGLIPEETTPLRRSLPRARLTGFGPQRAGHYILTPRWSSNCSGEFSGTGNGLEKGAATRAAIVFADGWDYTEFSQIGPRSARSNAKENRRHGFRSRAP